MSSGSEDRSPIASPPSRRAAAAAADRNRRGKAKRDLRSPSYLSLRNREDDSGRRSRSPTSRRRARRRSSRYFDDQVERHSRSRSRSPRRRRRARSNSYRDEVEEEPDRRSPIPSPRRRRAPRSCRSRSRTRSEECEDMSCCRPRTPSPGDGGGEVNMSSPPAVNDSYMRIVRPDDLFKCAHCFELLSSPVYECVDGHVTCSICHGATNEVEGGDDKCSRCGSTEYRRSRAVAAWLKSVRFPCDNHDYGCPAFLPHHKEEAHDRSCRYAPVFCPVRRCDFHGGPTDALERHLSAAHDDWSIVNVRYGHPRRLRARPTRSLLRAEDGALFHLCVEMGYHGGAALSMIRIRPDNAPAAEFTYEAKTIAAPGLQHRLQMQSTVWGTSLRDGAVDANPVSVTVPGDMLPREGPEQDSVEVCIVKVAPAGDRNNNN